MLILAFEGWFQVRLATDPDPSDEPRGVSGTTFALAGEPDFDRIVRFHDPVAPRSHGQPVGVFVTSPEPLKGARVEMLEDPIFVNHNNVVTISETEPMDPFHLKIAHGDFLLQRNDFWDPGQPTMTAFEAPEAAMRRRLGSLARDSVRVAQVTGITDYTAYRKARRAQLESDLARATDEIERVALAKRVRELSKPDDQYPTERLGYCMTYRFALNGIARVEDPGGLLGGTPDPSRDWPLELWLGAYDSDTLCGYASGVLEVPFR